MVTALFALVTRMMSDFGHGRKKANDVISCGKRSEACANRVSPQNNTF